MKIVIFISSICDDRAKSEGVLKASRPKVRRNIVSSYITPSGEGNACLHVFPRCAMTERECDDRAKSEGVLKVSRPKVRRNIVSSYIMPSEEDLIIFGDGSAEQDYCHINDAVRAYNLVLTSKDLEGKAINFASGKNTPVKEIAGIARGRGACIYYWEKKEGRALRT